jgi:hypothetical protein
MDIKRKSMWSPSIALRSWEGGLTIIYYVRGHREFIRCPSEHLNRLKDIGNISSFL